MTDEPMSEFPALGVWKGSNHDKIEVENLVTYCKKTFLLSLTFVNPR